MVNKYKLVNPYIKGEFNTKMEASNSLDAAKTFYKNLSEHFSNSVPKFYFTIQKGGNKFYHFQVQEKRIGDEVNYSITPHAIKDESTALAQYLENFEKFKTRFNGGAKRRGSKRGSKRSGSKRRGSKRDDSESDSSYDFYREAKSYVPVNTQPFYYMYYDPLVYRLDSLFIPPLYSSSNLFWELGTYIPYLTRP
jgi:hypothetical protein